MIFAPRRSLSLIFSVIYIFIIAAYIFTDVLIVKSRYFLIMWGILYVALSSYDLYGNTFDNWNVGSVVAVYTVIGNAHKLMARPVLRAIYLQILFLSANAVYTLATDRKMKFMLFATGDIYKATGTSSLDVTDASYCVRGGGEEEAT